MFCAAQPLSCAAPKAIAEVLRLERRRRRFMVFSRC
jgi:hypothetical protein